MKRIINILCVISLIIALCGCGKDVITEVSTGTNITVYEAKLTEIENLISYTGEIKASEETAVSSKVSGIVKGINAEIGDFIYAGDVLMVIDDTDYRLQYNQAKAAYNSAVTGYNQSSIQLETSVASAQLEYENATKNYERMSTLFDMGAISQVEFDNAKTRLTTAELNLNTSKKNYDLTSSTQSTIESAKAALDIAQNSLNNTIVKAPISGYVSAKNINLGQMVAAGNPAFTIKNTDVVNAEINVTESVIPYITVGTDAKIDITSANLNGVKGKVTVVNPVKNAQTGMYTVRITIDNKKGELKDGMFADVTLLTQKVTNTIVVPQEAIVQEGEDLFVFVTDGKLAEKVLVKTGISNDDYIQIVSGLKEGDVVVVSGKEYISEKNNEVNIVK